MIQKNYTIVQSIADYQKMEQHISAFDYFAFDTETTGLNVRKDKVIGLSICGEIGTAFYLPLFTWDKEFDWGYETPEKGGLVPVWAEDKFIDILKQLQKKELLMWNASYDIRIVKNNFNIDLITALFSDVMLMKHTVDEEGDFALKKVAIALQKELGLDVESAANEEQIKMKENVAGNGGETTKANYEMYKADLEVMGEYACADADLTLRIAEYYKAKLEEEGLEEFFYDKEVMPLYREVTIPMEEKGVCLDLPLIEQTKKNIEVDMSQLEKAILADLNAIPEVQSWLIAKSLEEFPAKATGSFAQEVCRMSNLNLPRTSAGKYSLTEKTIQSLRDSTEKNFLSGAVGTLGEYIDQKISWSLFCKTGGNEINISSKLQMGQITFDCLGIKPLGKTPTGKPQFDDDMIQNLADVHKLDWAIKLSDYNKLVKIRGTYIDRFLDAQEDGKYYFSYKQHGTISGRYSGDAQQLPRPKEAGELSPVVLKYNNLIRAFFISAPGRVFIDDDYESLEPHVFAHVSGDEGLRDIFRKGHDFYSSIAIPTENLSQYSADKKAENYLGKLAKPVRQAAKAYALGVPYGMTDYALGKSLNCSTEEAGKKIDGYLGGFPALKAWMEKSELQANVLGFVKSEAGRIRHLPKAKELYKYHKKQLLDFRYRQTLSKKHGKETVLMWYRDYKNSVNNAKNFQIQSLGASIVNIAAIAIAREFKKRGIDGWVCAQLHDQLVMDVPEGNLEECMVLVKELMENSTKLSLKLKAVPCSSKNWKDGH